jgi:hypothetical protein
MPVTIPTPVRALDSSLLRIAARTALLTNSGITAIVGNTGVFADIDAIGNPPIYVLITMPSDVPIITYTSTGINAILDITCVALGYASDADTVKYLVRQVMLDTVWAPTGFNRHAVDRLASVDRAMVEESGVRYYRGDRYRCQFIHA